MAGHPALIAGRGAVVTGAASGIGLATARRLAGLGLKVCLADLPGPALDAAVSEVAGLSPLGEGGVLGVATDVSDLTAVERLRDRALEAFGDLAFVMNNAAVDRGGGPFENYGAWRRLIEVNLWGVINGVHAFAPALLAAAGPAAIVNTGSKQGITMPPGNAAYNVSKAGVKAVTEALAHALREASGDRVTAHLLIPGFTYTGLTKRAEKPADAWTADQVADFMLDSLGRGDFYILCPDNAVTRAMDARRIRWGADDIVENRPALSRWHPAYKDAFEAWMREA